MRQKLHDQSDPRSYSNECPCQVWKWSTKNHECESVNRACLPCPPPGQQYPGTLQGLRGKKVTNLWGCFDIPNLVNWPVGSVSLSLMSVPTLTSLHKGAPGPMTNANRDILREKMPTHRFPREMLNVSPPSRSLLQPSGGQHFVNESPC